MRQLDFIEAGKLEWRDADQRSTPSIRDRPRHRHEH